LTKESFVKIKLPADPTGRVVEGELRIEEGNAETKCVIKVFAARMLPLRR